MRVFTETSEEVFSYIHHLGHSSVVYVDNSYLQNDSSKHVLIMLKKILKLWENLDLL